MVPIHYFLHKGLVLQLIYPTLLNKDSLNVESENTIKRLINKFFLDLLEIIKFLKYYINFSFFSFS